MQKKLKVALSTFSIYALGRYLINNSKKTQIQEFDKCQQRTKLDLARSRHQEMIAFNAYTMQIYQNYYNIKNGKRQLLNFAQGHVLDICSGHPITNISYYDPSKVKTVTFTDYIQQIINLNRASELKSNLRVQFIKDDITKSKFPDCSFDSVVSTFGLQFVLFPDQALNQIVRITKPGAKIIIMQQGRSYTNLSQFQIKYKETVQLRNYGVSLKRKWDEYLKHDNLRVLAKGRMFNGKIWSYVLQRI